MHLERMHGIIEHIVLRGMKPKRLDVVLHALDKFIRHKIYDQLICLYRGKISSKITSIRKAHRSSMQLQTETIILTEEGTWGVPSSGQKEIYEVYEMLERCSCNLKCTDCKACIRALLVLAQNIPSASICASTYI